MSALLGCFLVVTNTGGADQTLDNVVLNFSATWCGPCRKVAPIVARLKQQGYPIRKIDVDREPELARRFQITSIPAFIVLVNGKEVERTVRVVSESRLKRMLARVSRNSQTETSGLSSVRDQNASGRKNSFSANPFAKQRDRQPSKNESKIAHVNPMSSSVRIRVHDNKGVNYGSGTIIDSQPGKSLVVTCGHIFRHVTNASKIDVEIFDGGRIRLFAGKVVKYDLDADVGLMSINTPTRIPSVRVAGKSSRPKQGDVVFSVGCGGGDAPTKQIHRVTALNRYLGPDNIECTGVPVQGRSGGGLFNQKGEIVAICNAADPKDKRGLYAGTFAVHKLLDQVHLTNLYQPNWNDQIAKNTSGDRETSAFRTEIDNIQLASMRMGSQPQDNIESKPVERSLSDEMKELVRQSGDAEIVCIIRKHNDPRASSRIVVIHKASQKFVNYLEGELKSQPQFTSHRVEKKNTPARFQRVRKTTAEPTAEPTTETRRYRRSEKSRIDLK